MKLKIPKHLLDKEEYERIINEVPTKPTLETKIQTSQTPIIRGELSFITDQNLFKEINKYIKSNHPNLNNPLEFNNNVMKQSNPFLAVAIDMYLKQINSEYRIATQIDLEKDLEFTKGTYNDSGLALRNLTGDNKGEANYIFNQLEKRGLTENNFPIWLNLRGLELTKDLNFNLTDESFYKTAEALSWASGTNFSKINDFGLPKERDNSATRQIWTNQNYALSRCYLYYDSNLSSSSSELANSGDDGRVMLSKSRSG